MTRAPVALSPGSSVRLAALLSPAERRRLPGRLPHGSTWRPARADHSLNQVFAIARALAARDALLVDSRFMALRTEQLGIEEMQALSARYPERGKALRAMAAALAAHRATG